MATTEPHVTETRPAGVATPTGRTRLVPIAPEGWPFVLPPLAAAFLAGLGRSRAALPLGALAGFLAFFFRDPERIPPPIPEAILAPADGRVTEVRDLADDPFVGPARQVVIFLSPLDVHVNRAAIAGRVVRVEYSPGSFRPAYQSEAEWNEQVSIALESEVGRVVMRQVAGVLARRIVCRVREGDRLEAGDRFGMIKFGSRMDVVMPARARVLVVPGHRVRGGESVIGVME
jgi:phosphatidylserine decarboxylase